LKQRLFIGFDPDDILRQEIISLQQNLEKLNLPLVFEPAEKLHLTLNFIGKSDKSDVGKIGDMLTRVVAGFSPFNLTPAYLETLYQKHGSSLVYLGFSGDTQTLKSLQMELREQLTDMHIPQPGRFLPHITIGRFKKADPSMTKSFMDQIPTSDFSPLPAFTVDNVSLYDSLLSREGSHYRRLRRIPLQSEV
jgi:2'-5' RNA ligase